ncbi:hypothetical protein ACRAWG_12240 [Methylobacterium sp. P31]
MSAKERSLSIGACQSCGKEIRVGDAYCVPCATANTNRDAAYFDRWLLIFACAITAMIALYLAYVATRYLGLAA